VERRENRVPREQTSENGVLKNHTITVEVQKKLQKIQQGKMATDASVTSSSQRKP
jgi:hypothetical protein